MTNHDTTTLVFVRTDEGVVKVPAGQRVPHNALPAELDRLLAAGAVAEATEPVTSTDITHNEPEPASPRSRSTRKSD